MSTGKDVLQVSQQVEDKAVHTQMLSLCPDLLNC